MQEEANKQIYFRDVDAVMLRIVSDFIVLGPSCNDSMEIPRLDPLKAYQLMDVCSQMFLSYACTYLARNIESITEIWI